MEYWLVTSMGKKVIPRLEDKHRYDEATILRHLVRVGSSTVENIAYVCGTSETEARFKLKIMQGERWVAVNRTKMVT